MRISLAPDRFGQAKQKQLVRISLAPDRFGLIIQRGIKGYCTRKSSVHPITGFLRGFNWRIIVIQSQVTSHCLSQKMASKKRGRKKVALEPQLNKITGYMAPTSSSDATAIVHNILEQLLERCDEPQYIINTIVDDLLHKIGGTDTESTTKHAGDKVSDRTVRSWTAKYPWLIVEKEGNERKMLCSVCKSAQQRLKLTTVWATEGNPNYSTF